MNCIRVYGGHNKSNNPATLFDVDGFVEKEFVDQIQETSGNVALAMNWYFKLITSHRNKSDLVQRYNSFKVHYFFSYVEHQGSIFLQVASYYCTGHISEAASLGFTIYQTRDIHPKYVFLLALF